MGKYGTNLEGFGAFEGGVNADKGAPLISTSSDGETALLFGPAALREIQSGVANGDFAIPPDAAGDTITEQNPLPYFTFTDVNSAGAITCAIVADASAGSGNSLRWSVTAATANSRSAKLTRFIPVAATRNRAFCYIPEVNTFAATNTANVTMQMQAQFVKVDLVTNTGTAINSGVVTFATLGTGINQLTGATSVVMAVPSDAAFLLLTVTVATAAAGVVPAATVDIPEIRLIRGDQTNFFAEFKTPATFAPAFVRQVDGVLSINPNGATGLTKLGGDLTVSGGDVNLSTTHIIKPLSASTMTMIRNDLGTRSALATGVLFPGNQTTRSIGDNGTDTTFSGGIDVENNSSFATDLTVGEILRVVNGMTLGGNLVVSNNIDIQLNGSDSTVPITGNGELQAEANTTTLTTNSARWVLLGGVNYALRRDSSTRRVKTNIVEADKVVLAAAKNLRAVHYEALEKDAEGNLVPSGQHTLGLIAEEIVEAGLGCAVTYDGEGLPDGYDERVIIAALLHRVNDLEERLKALESR